MSDIIAGLRPDLCLPSRSAVAANIHVAYCPERVLPGRILVELQEMTGRSGEYRRDALNEPLNFIRPL